MKIIIKEREMLPIIRDPYSNLEAMVEIFFPVIDEFIQSGNNMDEYKGWAFSFKIFRKGSSEYLDALSQIDTTRKKGKNSWLFYPSNTDRNKCIWVYDEILVCTHLESWLWFE